MDVNSLYNREKLTVELRAPVSNWGNDEMIICSFSAEGRGGGRGGGGGGGRSGRGQQKCGAEEAAPRRLSLRGIVS